MRFIDPNFLFALFLVVIPILIHFFHFKRYKTVYFSQVGFLQTIKQEAKKKNNLKQLLILLSRIFAISFLVIAFAQPYLPQNKHEKMTARQLVGIYIDNSFSMKNMTGNGQLLEEAKKKAVEIATSYGPGANFLLLTNKQKADQQMILSRDQLIAQVSKISACPVPLELSKAYQLLANRLSKADKKTGKTIYFLTDFQKYTSDFSKFTPDSTSHIYLIPFTSQASDNLLIDTCWFETPGRRQGQNEVLHVRIQNHSGQTYQNIPVRLLLNDSLKAISTITIGPNEKAEFELKYQNKSAGFHLGKVEIDDYPIVYDNTYFFSYLVKKKANVLAVYNPEQTAIGYLEKLYNDDENINFTSMDEKKIQISQIPDFQCIFLLNIDEISSGLKNALTGFVKQGGTLCIFPGEEANIPTYNLLYAAMNAGRITSKDTSQVKMAEINYKHLLFNDVFIHENEKTELPYLKESYRFQTNINTIETKIISANNGNLLLAEYPFGTGRIYNFSFPLLPATTDFYRQAIFVPTVYNIALNSFEPQTVQYTMEDNQQIAIRKSEGYDKNQLVTIRKAGTDIESQLPVMNDQTDYFRIDPSAFSDEAGFYELGESGEIIKILAFNYNRMESRSDYYTPDELSEFAEKMKYVPEIIDGSLPDFREMIKEANDGTELWKLFAVLAILFVMTEMAIIRLMK